MSADLVHVLGQDGNHVGEDVEGVDLQVNELRAKPLSNAGVTLARRRVEVEEEGLQELLLN